MNVAAAQSAPETGRRAGGNWLLIACAAVFLFLFIQAATYSGLVERLAEWQFARFGRYFPTFTLALLLLLFAGIWTAIDRLRRRARRQPVMVEPIVRDIRRLANGARFLFIAAALSGLMALGVLVSFLQQPDMDGQPVSADLSRGVTTLQAGPMRLSGVTALGPVSRHAQDLLFWRTTRYFVPVGQTRLENGETAYNLFVEIEGPQARNLSRQHSGLLRLNALPSEVAQMYANARYPTARRSAVLFRSTASANRSTLILLGEFMVFALIATLFGIGMRRREQRLVKTTATT